MTRSAKYTFLNKWTPAEDAVLVTMRAEGKFYSEIAETLPGRTGSAARSRGKAIGLDSQAPKVRKPGARRHFTRPYTLNDDQLIMKLHASGHTFAEIASVMSKRTPLDVERRFGMIQDYEGRILTEVLASVAAPRATVLNALKNRGYSWPNGVLTMKAPVSDLRAELEARLAAAPDPFPCGRCGAARGCEHRVAAWSPSRVAA